MKSNAYSSITLARNGDLLGYTYFTVDNGTTTFEISDWTQLIESVQLVVGGQVIDEQTSDFSQNIALDMFAKNVSKGSLGPGVGPRGFIPCDSLRSRGIGDSHVRPRVSGS